MNLYNSEGYFDPTAYEALTRIEREEKKMQKINTYRPLVYICSPYRSDTEQNILNARKYSRFAVNSHYIPIAPHLLFTQFIDLYGKVIELLKQTNCKFFVNIFRYSMVFH